MSGEHRFNFYRFYRGVEIKKADSVEVYFASVKGFPLMRHSYAELCNLIDCKITLAANTPREDE